ncbi:MAG: hypothetical protein IPO95_11610 [Rhodanobacteraceae bacterium]|nr:hypothetical protein [Rhodanobacteraceae bacterium]MBL0042410.1 hypothetical protein [Xanthomonadales bacterium]
MSLRKLGALLFALLPLQAHAEFGTIDDVPAATLLIPHFEVDTLNRTGVNTVITLTNASASAAVAQVTLWTDEALPTARFGIYLTGYDQQTIDLQNVFNRFPPVTADAGSDTGDTSNPDDGISNKGDFSQDINFPGAVPPCSAAPSDIELLITYDVKAAHTGLASLNYFGGSCGAINYGDGIARGYVTIDTVTQCTTDSPYETAFFPGGIADRRNILMGSYVISNANGSRMVAANAVHVESRYVAGPAPSYGLYSSLTNYSTVSEREALPTAWAGRAVAGKTDLNYWRDPGQKITPVAGCAVPAAFPLPLRDLSVFSGNGTNTANPAGALFPYASGRVAGSALSLAASPGWLFANLNSTTDPDPMNANDWNTIRQSWLTFEQYPSSTPATSGFAYTVEGIQLGNAADLADPIVP